MITEAEIETYAEQIAAPGFATASIEPLIGHLDDADFGMVLKRASGISRARGRAADTAADSLETLTRLAHAAGCPAGVAVLPWLQERGLAEEVESGWRYKVPKPGI